MLSSVRHHDEFAVLPAYGAPASETIEIVAAEHIGVMLVMLCDGRTFSKADGRPLDRHISGCIVAATNAHREALRIASALERLVH
jgi:hypothetical protein